MSGLKKAVGGVLTVAGALIGGPGGALLGSSIGGAIDERNNQKAIAKKEKDINALNRAIAADRAARERRAQIRQERIAAARIANTAAVSGQSASSAPIGAVSNVQSDVSENIGLVNNTLASSNVQGKLQQDIFNLQQPSDLAYVSQVVKTGANIFGIPTV